MAQQNSSQAPDLATVLRNLAALAPAASQPATPHSLEQPQLPAASPQPAIPNAGNNGAHAPLVNYQQPADPRLAGRPPKLAVQSNNYPNMSPAPSPSSTPKPTHQASSSVINPATITEWSQGLRCISKIAAQNPNFRPIIQKMISDQHEHELIWWGGRQALMSQKPRDDELKAYDAKVHRAQREMFNAMAMQLKSLGVPFFGMKPELIMSAKDGEATYKPSGAQSESKAKITDVELLKLQRKMLEYLEDMYKD